MNISLDIAPPSSIRLRRINGADHSFLQSLYASTREHEMRRVPWNAAQKTSFLASQFELQHQHYQAHYDASHFNVIELASVPIGRLYLAWVDGLLRIVDIALIPSHRGQGIGKELLLRVIEKARQARTGVSIHVERENPAMNLYLRLGFKVEEDRGVYLYLVRRCEVEAQA